MRAIVIVAILALMLPFAGTAEAVNVTVDPLTLNLGFINWFELDGVTPAFSSGWGFNDLTAVYTGSQLTLGPNTIGDPDPYWYIGGGGPGAPGNKIADANGYAEVLDGSLAGQTVTFTFTLKSNTLTGAHVARAFIRDFAPDFSSNVETTVDLTAPGTYSISLDTINDPLRPVQWGFQMVGVNVWVTDVGPFGTAVVGPESPISVEASSWGQVKSLFR